ncbi:MAG: chemotaxis protein CheD [Candidatus Aminicenantes bacterium]|nr:chemotaxis protein CheD [Candidatus Aminicenantes bacterium]
MDKSIFRSNTLAVGVGDYKISTDGHIIETVLGCCIGICLYDEAKKIGGLLHIMLPAAPNKKAGKPSKYADTGIKEILQVMKAEHSIFSTDLKAKIFGGAKMKSEATYDIGQKNADKVREILKINGIQILNEKVGGEHGYKIDFDISTGIVYCRVFGQEEEQF